MVIKALFIFIGLILDAITATVFKGDFSYQSLVLSTFFTLNFFIIQSLSMSKRQIWITGLVIAGLFEMMQANSYMISFLVIPIFILLLNFLKANIGESNVTRTILCTVLIFCYQLLNYVFYRMFGVIGFSLTTFLQVEVVGNILLNFIVVAIVLYFEKRRVAYLNRQDLYKRQSEKILIMDREE